MVKTIAARQYTKSIQDDLLLQRVPTNYIAHPVIVEIDTHPKPSQEGDYDNCLKLVLDSLVRFGVLLDDKRKIIKRIVITESTESHVGWIGVRILPWRGSP